MYAFLFDKKSLALLILGAAVLGGLLFFAGFLVGIENGFPSAASQVAAKPAASPSPSPSPFPRPASAPPAVPAGAGGDAPAGAADALPEEEAGPGEGSEVPAGLDDGAAASEEPPAWEELPLAEPEPAPAIEAPAAPAASPVETGFALQVGAFRDKRNSDSVVEDLAGRGYEPYVVEIRTPRRRILRAVRIGRYPDRGEAARAAMVFAEKERMQAVVLPASF